MAARSSAAAKRGRSLGRLARICVVADSAEADHWMGLAADGVHLLDLAETAGQIPTGFSVTSLRGQYAPRHDFTPLVSLCAYHWLAQQDFDLIVFAGRFGAGYYSTVAKGLGLAFRNTTLAVLTRSCHAFRLEEACRFPQGRTDIELDFLERQTLRRADVLVSGASAFPDWCGRAGWALPEAVLIAPGVPVEAMLGHGPAAQALTPAPFISVCLATHNRPALLAQAVASLVRQSYPHFEVIVIDDGSTDPGVAVCLDGLEELFQQRGWTILRQPNAGVSAARNAAAAVARGGYLLFMDDDNIALAHEIERFATAAMASGADVITCIPGHHPETDVGPGAVAELPGPDPDHPL
ncbi:MAG TPA: glycosyltransferase family 2 protein, partial [Patescibacteria group bacterium]|nr:glycosyltransferase family 2 protein [Patescibacteria group bacterium]